MPDKHPDAAPFIRLTCPAEWEQAIERFILLVKTACQIGRVSFKLRSPHQITMGVRRDKTVYMVADWRLNEIEVGLPYHPDFSVWLFSVYFGLAHEVGHLLWHTGPLTLREAWGHYFALYVLQAQETRQALNHWRDRVLLSKDCRLSQGILKFQQYLVSPVDRATAQLTRVFCKAGKERVSAFVTATPERTDNAVLLSRFSQYFEIPEMTCQGWLRDE